MMLIPVIFKFRLYIVGAAPNSLEAVSNLGAFCREHLPERHDIEIVDVVLDPMRALHDGVVLTPTLVNYLPEPTRRIVGTLSDRLTILDTLGLLVAPS
jgi:circadian clock protein KaiB